jgi:hypothetical protein
MHYFHIKYTFKKKVKKHVLKAENKMIAKSIFYNSVMKNSKAKILNCKRSSVIQNNTPTYDVKDAKWIVYQNLNKKTRKRLSVKDVKTILSFFYYYLEENGFMSIENDSKVISHLRDENIPSIYEGVEFVVSAFNVCSYAQYEALIKKNKLFYFDDIYSVFVAETKYLEETGLA